MTTNEILQCNDINILFEERVTLTEKIGNHHRSVKLSKGEVDEADHKAELTTAYAVMDALNHRLGDLEEIYKQNRDEEGRIRYNFMKIAKVILTKETYDKIRNMSENSLKEMKPMFKDLRKTKASA